MANDRAVPTEIRNRYKGWGLPADEFTDTDHWPHQLYVREARRMVADYVVTEADCRGSHRCGDGVSMAAYQMDSHNCTRAVVDGHVVNEGDVQVKLPAPYPISYRAMVPARGECENLLVPVCVSASHIAFGSVRMEPVFMALAESAAVAARLSIAMDCAVQEVPYAALRSELERLGQVLETSAVNAAPGNPE